jgi:hypothetical protein
MPTWASAWLSRRVRHVVFAAGSLYWLVPGHATLAVRPAPPVDALSVLGVSCLWLLCYGMAWGREPAGRARAGLLAACLAAAVAAGSGHALRHSEGILARYYDNPTFEGGVQPSWTATCAGCTRVDPQIAFGSRGYAFTEQYFPLFFANDVLKRQWSPSGNPSTDGYRFSAEWTGFVTARAPARLRLEAAGGDPQLVIDGTAADTDGVAIAPGTHAFQVRYARTSAEAPSLRLRWDEGRGYRDVPAGAFRLGVSPARRWLPAALDVAGLAAWITALLLLRLNTGPARIRVGRAVCWAGFQLLFLKSLAEIAVAGSAFGFQVFMPGNDYLAYETFARQILSGDLLSRLESPFVHWNFGYRYVLSALHLAAGEAPADVMVLEQAAKSLLVILVSARVARLYGARAGIATAAVIVGCHQLARLEPPMLDTPWSVGISAVALFALIDHLRSPSSWTASAVGLSLGVAGLLRPNLVPLVAAAVLWIAVTGRGASRAGMRRHVLIVVGLSVMVLSLLPLRNVLVGGKWRWLPENGLVNLWVGNHPPEFDGPTYFIVKWTPPRGEIATRVLNYCVAEPGALAERVARKTLYVLGVDPRSGGAIVIRVLLPWVVAAAGSLFLWSRRAPIRRAELLLLWTWVVLVNVPLVAIYPWSYGWRLSAPSFVPLYTLCGTAMAACLSVRRTAG